MRQYLFLIILSISLTGCADETQKSDALIVRFKTDKSFTDVVQELEFAITERNFRITGRNTIGEGIRKRDDKAFPDIEVIHFCSLDVAKEVLDIDPGFVAQMPCRVTVHEQDNAVIISLILLPTDHKDPRVNEFAARMNRTLREIVDFVLEENAEPLIDS